MKKSRNILSCTNFFPFFGHRNCCNIYNAESCHIVGKNSPEMDKKEERGEGSIPITITITGIYSSLKDHFVWSKSADKKYKC